MTTRYERTIVLPGMVGLHGVAHIRSLVAAKVAIERETVQIDTGDRKIEEASLAEAVEAVEPTDRTRVVHLELFTCRGDELAVAITYVASRNPLRRRRGTEVHVRGTDEVAVLGLAACLQRLRDQRPHRGGPRSSDAPANRPGGDGRGSEHTRTWWWRNITAGAVAQIVAAVLLALGSMLLAFVHWK